MARGSFIPDPLDTSCDFINAAGEMYSKMYEKDKAMICDPKDLRKDLDNIELIIADCAFRSLYHVFDTEILGDAL